MTDQYTPEASPVSAERQEQRSTSSTEVYLQNLAPEVWQKFSAFSSDQVRDYWNNLALTHINDFKRSNISTPEFIQAEVELIYLNYFRAQKAIPLDSSLPVLSFGFFPGQEKVKSQTFQQFTDAAGKLVESQLALSDRTCRILVTGEGVNGKASVRTVLTEELSRIYSDQVLISLDRDYYKGPFPTQQINLGDGTRLKPSIYIVEDIHGLDDNLKRIEEEKYGGVVCVIPNLVTYRHNLLERGLAWVEGGVIDLTDPKMENPNKIKQTAAQHLDQMFQDAPYWLQEQSRNLHKLRQKQIPLIVVEPSAILDSLYPNRRLSQHLVGKEFIQSLSDLSTSKSDLK